jgi:hypothetical protein
MTRALFSMAVLVAVIPAGCGFDQLHLRAAHELDCASDKLEVTQIDDDRTRFVGCGKTATYFCATDTHGYERCSIERPNPRATVQDVAGKDFGCPTSKIEVDDAKDGFSAKGCNRSDVYTCTPVLTTFRCVRQGIAIVASSAAASSSSAPSSPPAPSAPK